MRDKSRSVNSIDVVFNFDCIGFTGTPFLDNYPTFDYIRNGRKDDIPDLIDRSFYAYSSDNLSIEEFEKRFALFQGQNSNVLVEYISRIRCSVKVHKCFKIGGMEMKYDREGEHGTKFDQERPTDPAFEKMVKLGGLK